MCRVEVESRLCDVLRVFWLQLCGGSYQRYTIYSTNSSWMMCRSEAVKQYSSSMVYDVC